MAEKYGEGSEVDIWLKFFEDNIPRWWMHSPGPEWTPLAMWFRWTENCEVDVDDPASLAYPPGVANEVFFHMVLDQQYGRGPADPFVKIYEKVRAIGDLREIEASLCTLDILRQLGKEGRGYWRFQRIPQDLIANVRTVIERTHSSSFEKYLHQVVGEILGTKRFTFPEVKLPDAEALTFAQEMVMVLLSPRFKLRSVGENMASYGLRHLTQIPGALRLFKVDYHNLHLGTRESIETKFGQWSAELIRKCGPKYPDVARMFSPAVLNMAIYVGGRLKQLPAAEIQ